MFLILFFDDEHNAYFLIGFQHDDARIQQKMFYVHYSNPIINIVADSQHQSLKSGELHPTIHHEVVNVHRGPSEFGQTWFHYLEVYKKYMGK